MDPSQSVPSSAPELLAPAGDWSCARAAVANGADAVYFGLDTGFNARARATNFSLDNLPALMEFLHRHRVAGYVAEVMGECRGRILAQPAEGPFGFGYDALFEVQGHDKTLAELPPQCTGIVGHRSRAVRALLEKWPPQFGSLEPSSNE